MGHLCLLVNKRYVTWTTLQLTVMTRHHIHWHFNIGSLISWRFPVTECLIKDFSNDVSSPHLIPSCIQSHNFNILGTHKNYLRFEEPVNYNKTTANWLLLHLDRQIKSIELWALIKKILHFQVSALAAMVSALAATVSAPVVPVSARRASVVAPLPASTSPPTLVPEDLAPATSTPKLDTDIRT